MTAEIKEFLEKAIAQTTEDPEIRELLASMGSDMEDAEKLLGSLMEADSEPDPKIMESAGKVFDGIKAFFDEKGWHSPVANRERGYFLIGFKMMFTSIRVDVHVEAEVEAIRINAILPVICEEEYRLVMGSYLTRLNQHLRFGAFHLDEDDGEITYRFSYSYAGEGFNKVKFEQYLDACTITPDGSYRPIVRFATGRFTDEEKVDYFHRIKAFAVAING